MNGSGKMQLSKLILWILLVLILVLRFPLVDAQNELLKFENYSKDNGLLHSQILSIYQDKQGLLWIGSYGGLNRFDGTNFISYTTENSELPTNVILSIHEPKYDAGNSLWLGTYSGLVKFNKETNTFEYFERLNTRIVSITEDEDGILWAATFDQGLLKFDPESKAYSQTSLSNNFLFNRPVFSINCSLYEQPGILWLGSDQGGLYKYNCKYDSYEVIFEDPKSIKTVAPNNISCLYSLGSEMLIGTIGGGLYTFDKDEESLQHISLYLDGEEEIHKSITHITQDNSGNIWISSFGGGLYKIEGFNSILKGSSNYSIRNFRVGNESPNTICSDLLNLVYKDYAGNLWIGSEGGGLGKLDFFKHKISHFMIELPDGKKVRDNNISAVFEDEKGNIWYGLRNNGLYIYNGEKDEYKPILLYPENTNDRRNVVHFIYGDMYNRIWVSTDLGLFMFTDSFEPAKYFALNVPNASTLTMNTFITMCLDQNDALWLSDGENGLYRLDADEIEKPNPENAKFLDYTRILHDSLNLSSNRIWGITQDSNGSIWISTSGGLYKYNAKEDNFDHLFTTGVNCVFEPESGSGDYLWMGSYGNGIFLFNKTDLSSINFNTSMGLCHDNVSGIVEDKLGNIWVSTAKGIASIYTKGLYSSEIKDIENESNISRIHNYWKSDGLQAHEFNLAAAGKLSNEKLVFGGPNGINLFDPLTLEENKYVYPVLINDFKIFNKSILKDTTLIAGSIEYLKEIKLNHKQNYITIDFTAICFTSPEKAEYQYMLEGFDNEWVTADSDHTSATYTEIRAADYIFKVKATNADGFVNDEITALKISIEPPFWETLQIKILGIILLSVILVLIILNQKRKLSRNKNRILQSQKEMYEKEKIRSDLENKNRELAITTMYIVKKNEKLIQVRNMMHELKENILANNKSRFLEILTSIDNDVKNQDNWESFELNFNLIHNNFIARFIEKYPTLSQNDVKICAYMRMNLSSKEIANLLSITPKSLETNRVRIRKRIKLDSSVYLGNYIMRF